MTHSENQICVKFDTQEYVIILDKLLSDLQTQRIQFHTLFIIDEKKVACFLRYYTLVKYCFF